MIGIANQTGTCSNQNQTGKREEYGSGVSPNQFRGVVHHCKTLVVRPFKRTNILYGNALRGVPVVGANLSVYPVAMGTPERSASTTGTPAEGIPSQKLLLCRTRSTLVLCSDNSLICQVKILRLGRTGNGKTQPRCFLVGVFLRDLELSALLACECAFPFVSVVSGTAWADTVEIVTVHSPAGTSEV